MARDLSKNTSNFLRVSSTSAIAQQLNGSSVTSMFCRVWLDTLTTAKYDNVLFDIRNAANDGIWLAIHDGTAARLVCYMHAASGELARERISTATVTTGQWQSVGCVTNWAGDTITPYVNGVASNGGAAAFTSTTFVTTGAGAINEYIGSAAAKTTGYQIDGRVADWTMWNRDVTAEEFAALHRGLSPLELRPTIYYDLGGFNLFDPINGRTLTVGGTVAAAEHPPMLVRRRLWVPGFEAAVDEATAPYRLAAQQLFVAGADQGEPFVAGAQRIDERRSAGQAWHTGAVEGQVAT